MVGLMIAQLAIQTMVQYYQTYSTNSLGQSVIRDLRKDVFNHIMSLRLKYFDRTPIGMLITRTVSDLETIADIFSEGLISIVGRPVAGFGYHYFDDAAATGSWR